MAQSDALYYKQNRLKQLRAFCFAARHGSISKAAEMLFLSQPSVSLQIQALEREVGTQLFERRGPKILLTPDGERLLELSQPLVDGIDSLAESFAAHRGDLRSGELNVAAGESTILYVLPDIVTKFAETYPGIRLKLHNVTGRDGLDMIRADEVDLAVGPLLEIPEDIDYFPVLTYHPVLIMPRGHPLAEKRNVTLEDISPYGLILPPRRLTTWRVVEMVFQQYNVSYSVAMEAGGYEVIKKYVALGLGISIVTDVCLVDSDDLVSRPLDRYFPSRSYGVVVRGGKFLSPQARRFIELVDPDFASRDPQRHSPPGRQQRQVRMS